MIKKYWPIAVGLFLGQFVPLVMEHTGFERYIAAYLCVVMGFAVLLLISVVIVRRNRRKTTLTERL